MFVPQISRRLSEMDPRKLTDFQQARLSEIVQIAERLATSFVEKHGSAEVVAQLSSALPLSSQLHKEEKTPLAFFITENG